MAFFINPTTGKPGTTNNQVKVAAPPGRPTLPSQLQPIRPQPQPVVRPAQPANPFQRQSGGGPGAGPVNMPGGGGGVVRQPPPLSPTFNLPTPPAFNLPSPVPDLRYQQPPAINLNTTPGQLGNQVPPPAAGMGGTGPLGSAPPTVGSDVGPPGMSGGQGGPPQDTGIPPWAQIGFNEPWNIPDQGLFGGTNPDTGLPYGVINSGGPAKQVLSQSDWDQQMAGGGGGIMNLPGGGGSRMSYLV